MAACAARATCYTLYRVVLPVVLLVAAAVRFNALSFLYAIFLLLNPLLSSPTPASIRGSTGIYLRIVFIVGLLGVLAHAVFHITLGAIATDTEPYGSMFQNCSSNERLARQIAVERLDGVAVVDIIRLVLPDVVVFVVGLIIYITCYKLLPAENSQIEELPSTVKTQTKPRCSELIRFIGEFVLLLFLAASGIIVPGVLSAVYFLSFIFLATLWSFYGHLGVKFSVFRVILLIYSAAHILLLHLYQFQFFQEAVSPDDFIPRLLGLTAVVYTNCDSPYQIFFKDVSEWPNFVNPVFLLLLYYTLAFEIRRSCHRKAPGVDVSDGAERSKRRRRQKGGERQVVSNLDESQKEHLVDAEVRDYSAIEQPETDRSGSTTLLASDTEKEDVDEPDRPEKSSTLKRKPLVSALVYIMRQSYVLSLIAMMAWSITFHSWLTFVLLLAACFIWMMPNSRRVCYMASPVILLYGIALIIIQFVYGMNLTDSELPKERTGIKLADIGLKKFPYPCLQLALQVLYTLMFWLTLRQYMRERRQSILAEGEKYQLEPVSSSDNSPPTSPQSLSEMLNFPFGVDLPDGYDSNTMKLLGQYSWYLLCKYWIFVCSGMLLIISLQEVVIYRIIYMILFLLFILCFQFIYALWRLTLLLFWWVVIVYSMFVLVVLYTYQFDNVADFWQNSTQLSIDTLADIGLEKFDTAGLFIRLLTPTSFLIFIIIQVHYFHKPFLLLSDLDRFKNPDSLAPKSPAAPSHSTSPGTTDSEAAADGGEKKKKSLRKRAGRTFRKFWLFAAGAWETFTRFLWRLAEIHISKLVALTIILVCVYEVSAISAVYVILLVVFLPMTGCPSVLSHLVQVWTALVLLSKMIYQLRLVDNSRWLSNCTENNKTNITFEPPFDTTIDNAVWAGLNKTDSIAYYLRNYIGILLVVIFERIIVYHQRQHFNTPDIVKPKTGIIFPDINRQKADEGVVSCLKYFFNYFFYKFGLELCYIMSAITICIRVDITSLIYALLLGLALLLSRRGNTMFWPIYTIILVVLLPVQFLLVLGLPVGFCYKYPWDRHIFFNRQLEKWLYLPDYIHPPMATKLIADFFQLLFVCLQWRVFRWERAQGPDRPDGGSNEDIIPEVEAKMKIPVEDFTTKITSYLDIIKNFVFTYMFWVTLAIVFIAGTARINLFSMGYVIAVFCFMWFGQEFLIKPLRKLLRAWNFLIGYCFLVLLFKAALQLPGCVYIEEMVDNACWLVQLLGLTCLKPAHSYPNTFDKCPVQADNSGLAWDVVCFTFLLLQRRIYACHYFRHVVADFEAQNRLASRGCQLINKILRREVEKQREEEKTILANIKRKMDLLKTKQARFKGNYVEPEEHFQAIRSGDYYLFEDTSEDEEEDEGAIDSIKFGTDEKEGETGPSPLQLISTAVNQGTDDAVKKAEEADEAAHPTSPKPTTSAGDETDGQQESKDHSEEEEEKGGIVGKITTFCKFIVALLASCIDWCINLFNKISRNYRLVAAKLKDDHVRVKQQIQSEQIQLKQTELELEEKSTDESKKTDEHAEDGAPSETTDLVEVTVEPAASMEGTPHKSESISVADLDHLDDETEFEENQPRVYRLLVATYFMLISRTELLCYFLMILNHIMNTSLLSLPLPMFVFLWGMLSVPRPTKTFWITVITYTEAVVVVKYLFQFGFFPWNTKAIGKIDDPYYPPKIIGIEQKDNFAALDLVLLLALFIHRIFLKRYGLWRDEEEIVEVKDDSIRASIQYDTMEGATDDLKAEDRKTSSLMVEPSVRENSESLESLPSESKKRSKLKTVCLPFYNFYKQLTAPDYSATKDVYASMFLCDFINFLIILLGYQSFGPAQSAGGGDVASYISDNRIPVPFLIMLLAQFVLIIIDRALYLRKNVLGKFIFQILLVIVIHVWLFFALPYITMKSFTENKVAQLWYFIKCVYFGLSAYQIKSAYPTRILGNFLTKKYNYVNLILFKVFLAIPFLLELRTLMDWMWTNTTMAVGSWLQMEDIYANIYVLKCFRVIEKNHPTPRAVPKKAVIKYGVGGLLLFVVIFIIWFPLVIFSFANTVYEANPPTECSISVALAGYQPLFTISGQQQNIKFYTDRQFSSLKGDFDKSVFGTSFLSNYDPPDVTKIQLDGKSTSLWGISPPSLKSLISDLQSDVTVRMEFLVTFKRRPHSEAGELLTQLFTKDLDKSEKNATAAMLSPNSSAPVTISNVFPEYMRLGMKTADPVVALLGQGTSQYTSISIKLQTQNDTSWWEILDLKDKYNLLTLTTFNERVAPAGLSVITGYGVIGLYVSFILLIGRVLRISTTGQATTISFRELPHVDNILRLCLDIYLVREMREFRLEEDLYAKLIFVYRSAETRVKWTRLPLSQILEAKKNL